MAAAAAGYRSGTPAGCCAVRSPMTARVGQVPPVRAAEPTTRHGGPSIPVTGCGWSVRSPTRPAYKPAPPEPWPRSALCWGHRRYFGAHPVEGGGDEVARVEAGGVAGVVDHGPADAAPGVVRAQRNRIRSRDHPGVCPVQVVRPGLVAHPVGVGIPERPASRAATFH